MSGHNYVTNPNSLFEDDDVDDETFLKNSRVNPTSANSTNPFEQQKQAFEEKRREIENRTLESSKRSLGLLIETEEVGKATAGELQKQREQLEKTSRQLDEIGATLRFSQKHLNGLKSVFGGLKNYLAGNREMAPRPPPSTSASGTQMGSPIPQDNGLGAAMPISVEDRYNSHPINRLRSDDVVKVQSPQKAFDSQLEENLGEMCESLSRLKNLGLDLKSEIESQNDLLDNMNDKIEDVDIRMSKQNKEMNKLLGK